MAPLLYEHMPFVGAMALVLLFTLVELAALLMGTSAWGWLNDVVPEGMPGGLLGWLHLGRTPFLALLVVFLTGFALTGLALNFACHALIGAGAPFLASVPLAFLAALFLVHLAGGHLVRLVPSEETYAVSHETLVGRIATMLGNGSHDRPAQAKVADGKGHTLYVMVVPGKGIAALGRGAQVLLVQQVAGTRFIGVPNPHPDLLV
jgi:hypothetical protein